MADHPDMNPLAAILSTGAAEAPSSAPGRSRAEAAPGFSPLLDRAMRNEKTPRVQRNAEEGSVKAADGHASAPDETSPRKASSMATTKQDVRAAEDGAVEAEEAQSETAADAAVSLVPRTTEAKPADAPVPVRVERSAERLDRDFSTRLDRVLQRMKDEFGYEVRVTETFRSQARQDELYAQGRTTPGPTVTWTKNSNHTRGRAADVLIVGADDAAYAKLATVAVEEGLRTLGPMDPGHIELPSHDARNETRAAANHASATAQPPFTATTPMPASVATVATPARVAEVAAPGVAISPEPPSENRTEPRRRPVPQHAVLRSESDPGATSPRLRESMPARPISLEAKHPHAPTVSLAHAHPVTQAVTGAVGLPPAVEAAVAHASHNSAVRSGIPGRTIRAAAHTGENPGPDLAASNGNVELESDESRPRLPFRFEPHRPRGAMALEGADEATVRDLDQRIATEAWPLRDLEQNSARPDRASLVTSALGQAASPAEQPDLRAAIVTELRQSLAASSPVEGMPGAQGTDIASRVARLLAIQDAAHAAPVSGVTLEVGPDDGLAAARIRLGARGAAIDALIDVADPAMATQLGNRVNELRRALERTGLEPASIVVRDGAAAAAVTGRSAGQGAENNTNHETGRQSWQQRRDPGAAEDQKNRRNSKENTR